MPAHPTEPAVDTDPMDRDVAQRVDASASMSGAAARGFAWIVGGRLGGQAAQFAASIVLARLLLPSAYGLVAVVWTFVTFAAMFNDLGLSAGLVQLPKMTERDASTAFALNGALGVFLTAAVIALRHPLANLFGQPRLAPLLALASLTFVLSVTPVPFAILERTMQFGKVAMIDICGSVLGLAVTVACAASGLGARSLIIGSLAGTVISSVAGLVCARWVPKAWPSRRSARHLLNFGGHLTGYNLAGFWARNVDNLLLGRFAGPAELGLYNRAYQLMLLPLGQVGGVLGRVLLPLFSNMQGDLPRLRAAMTRVSRTTAVLVFPTLLGLAAISHNFVLAAYGERWRGAILLVVILAISGLPQIFGIAAAQVCQAVGQARLLSTWGIVYNLTAIVAIVAGLPWGAEGVAIALAIRGFVVVPVEMMPAKRAIGVGTRALVAATVTPLMAAVVMAVCVFILGRILDGPLPIGAALAAQLVAGPIIYVAMIIAIDRGALSDALILVRQRRVPAEGEMIRLSPLSPDGSVSADHPPTGLGDLPVEPDGRLGDL